MSDGNYGETPSQTIGPFFSFALFGEDLSELVAPENPGSIRITGTVYDGAGEVVPDAMLEIWQADAAGRYAGDDASDESFSGFGRAGTDDTGGFSFDTIKPGVVPGPDGGSQAPHIVVSVFARGLLKRLVTRVYFPDEEEANAADAVLSAVEPDLRSTLVAREEESGDLRFDVRLQGEKQTAFFDV